MHGRGDWRWLELFLDERFQKLIISDSNTEPDAILQRLREGRTWPAI
jgi:hypothetical protein